MLITIQPRGFSLTKALKDFVRKRIEATLSHYRDHLDKVDVTLYDVNGPRGGEDMRCVIKFRPKGFNHLIVQETACDLYDAIVVCSNRARWIASRYFDRLKDSKRRSVGLAKDYSNKIALMEQELLGAAYR